MTLLWIALAIVGYLLIGGIVYAATNNGTEDDDDLTGVIFAWPILIFMYVCILIVDALKAFGYFIVSLFKHFIYEGEQNETEK